MDLRTQIAKKYRPDDVLTTLNGIAAVVQACAAHYSAPINVNNHRVNNVCFQTQAFADFTSDSWSHEALHLAAAQQEAEKPNNDMYAEWEPIVESDSIDAFDEARDARDEIQMRVRVAALLTHAHDTVSYSFWYHIGSGIWDWATVTVEH